MDSPLLRAVLLVLVAASTGWAGPTTPAVYRAETPGLFYATPRGAKTLDASKVRMPCFGGRLLEAWQVGSGNASAIIYVSSSHSTDQHSLDEAAQALSARFRGAGLRARKLGGFCALGVPAARITVRGPGNGNMLRALNPSYSGSISTVAHFVVTVRPAPGDGGSDTIILAMGCPSAREAAFMPRFREVVHGSGVLRAPGTQLDASPDVGDGAGSAEPVGGGPVRVIIESVPTIDDLLALTSAPASEAGPWASAQCPMPDGRMVAVTVLLGVQEPVGSSWLAPADDPSAVFVCVAASADRAWVLPQDDFRRLAQPTGDGLLRLCESSAMTPYADAWGFLSFLGPRCEGDVVGSGE